MRAAQQHRMTNQTIYFEESLKGDTFIEEDQCADLPTVNVWIKGVRKCALVIDKDNGTAFLIGLQ